MPGGLSRVQKAKIQTEKKYQAACEELQREVQNGTKNPNIAATARRHSLPYGTLRNRFLSKTKPHNLAHASQQRLNPAQEKSLVEWIEHKAHTAEPASKQTVRSWVKKLSGRRPGKNWIYQFLRRHPEIKLAKTSGLDPKRARAFNKPVVTDYFGLEKHILETRNVLPRNLYNMDEKGVQRGGGRKSSGRKYFVPRSKRPHYKKRSGNLELITIIECVAADGTHLQPGFVFPGSSFCPEWFDDIPDDIG